ncbi:uncharacterized protein LOC128724902 [Anopheles nili]|uniref:uncharacterized protein LOC128724902 n=1 Tax=Anopheles nili TaxID=185578 RepID=UPI00237B5903|nr:uncharacterized protein LOC128724902 [Anopheles nili]
MDRRLLVLTGLSVISLCWNGALARAFFYPAEEYQPPSQYYTSNALAQSATNSNGYYYRGPNAGAPTAAASQNVPVYSSNTNYYGVPGYDDYRPGASRNRWNDPYLRWKWNEYYNRNYYPYAGVSGWNDRTDGVAYYSKRRQDSPEATTQAVTTTSLRPSVPRKKKLFVPNVWG